jgi:peptide/nickel transport system substrate-binding protein
MLPPKYVTDKGDDFAAHPIGTGPFKFVEWVKGDRVTLEANPDYWRAKPLGAASPSASFRRPRRGSRPS